MPRAAKPKAAPAKKAKSKLYAMPEKIKEGTILTDLSKGQWRIGPSIGIGGFGEIYAASRNGEKLFNAVVKCEPHVNGPLFVEMHFYLRNAKLEDIKQFKKKLNLKSLGMPHILATGSADINNQKHRFIVMPRYGSDVQKFFVENGRRLPEGTVYRLALQMLDVFQFMHGTGYVHADLKAANILLGQDKQEGGSQAYLVDFGLASHFVTGDFKPDPRKMHNGTIEYTSRDAHLGVATRRSDLEILGYNLIEWLGVELPWVKQKLLETPVKVQQAKEAFMADVNASLKSLFPKGAPAAILDYMKYVVKLAHDEEPDYDKCRGLFANALKQMKIANSGELDFKLKSQSNNSNNSPPAKKAATKPKKNAATVSLDSSDDVILDTDEEQEEEKEYTPRRKLAGNQKASGAASSARRGRVATSAAKPSSASPRKREAAQSPSPQGSSPNKRAKLDKQTPKAPMSGKLNFSPAVSIRGRHGKTVINDDLTPQPRSSKTYELNLSLDVSMDANVIVNVKRKKKGEGKQTSTKMANGTPSSAKGSPATRVNLRKVKTNSPKSPEVRRSPRTPAVSVRKYKH
ncbi:hypothetical protein KR093_000314 [Drosophila rubida]|uniref:non-specific serine/threonine protein kinase n=1 Tax=Drosophila rubida TaxID=30044 RepID=A0AAD4K6S4_9MUSC|nr:hypothetical protein KR093_000314 [Drosophila rubida]